MPLFKGPEAQCCWLEVGRGSHTAPSEPLLTNSSSSGSTHAVTLLWALHVGFGLHWSWAESGVEDSRPE